MNKKKIMKGNEGITLVALVVTIVVLLILAGISINLVLGDNGIITKAQEARIAQELSSYKENMKIFITTQQIQDNKFDSSSLTAYKSKLYYNTKNEDNNKGIEAVLGNVNKKYIEKIEIVNGKIYLNTTNKTEQRVASSIGIRVNSWDVVDGTLLSSNKNLELVEDKDTVVIPPSIKKIGAGAFSGVTNLKKVIIPGTVEQIDSDAFSNNSLLEKVVIEDGVKHIGAYAFKNCKKLRSIDFQNSVTEMGEAVLQGCTALKSVKLSKNIDKISDYFFSYTGIEQITIPEGITSIGGYTFEGCDMLKKVTFSASVKEIGYGMFWNVKSLTEIEVKEANNNFKFENGLLMSKDGTTVYCGILSLEEITIPDGVKEIRANAFVGSSAKYINVPNSISYISGGEFYGMYMLKEIRVSENNEKYKTVNGSLYTKDGEELIRYIANGNTIIIPEGVKVIRTGAVQGMEIRELKLPSTLIELKAMSLNSVTGLDTVYIPENVEAFESTVLPNDAKVVVSESNKNIKSVDDSMVLSKDGKILYAACSSVGEFNIPNTVEIIDTQCFVRNYNIKDLVLPENVKEIRRAAFGYSTLCSIEIPNSTNTIAENAFTNCAQLTSIKINKEKSGISGSPWSCPLGERAVEWLK